MGAELMDKASEAAADLKGSAKQSAQHVKEEGQSSDETIKGGAADK